MGRTVLWLTALLIAATGAIADEAETAERPERTAIVQLKHVDAAGVASMFGGKGTGLPAEDPTFGRREFFQSALEDATAQIRPLPEMVEPGLYPHKERNYIETRVAQAGGNISGLGAQGGGLQSLLPEGLSEPPVALTDQNALIVRGTAEAIDEFSEIVALLDKPAQQVNIEVKLVTLSRRLDDSWGADLPVRGRDLQIDITGPAPAGGTALRYQTGNMAPLVSGTRVGSRSNNTTGAHVTGKSNHLCMIRATTLIPFVATTVTWNQFGQRSVDYTIDAVATGIELFCVPRVNADDSVTLALDPRFVTPTGEVVAPDGSSIPITQTFTATSEITVPDGQTLVLGGFPRSIQTLETVGLPINFRRTDMVEDAESVIFVTPRIVRTPQP